MKKLLLSLLTVLVAVSAFAYEPGDYMYTKDAKFKVIGDNLVPALSAWNGMDVDVWSVYQGEDATENCLLSLDGGESASPLTTSVSMSFGSTYVVTMKIKGSAENASANTDGGQNQIDAWVTLEDASGVKSGETGVDYIQVAQTYTILNGEFTEISFAYTAAELLNDTEEATCLNIKIGRLTTESVIADVEVREVTQVYDTRIMDRKIDFINQLMANESFSGADHSELDEVMGMYVEGQLDVDDSQSMADYEAMLDEARIAWMDESSDDLSSNFQNIEITGFPKQNRGTISDGQVLRGFIFHGDNWLHGEGSDFLNKQIQQGYGNNAGSVALYNTNLPAAKYYLSFEARVANLTTKSGVYTYTWTREDSIKAFVGSDTIELGSIKGEEWKKFFVVADLKEGETFEAGAWWPGHTTTSPGSSFQVRNFEIRAIKGEGESVGEKLERKAAYDNFMAQYNAAKSAYNNVNNAIGNANFPWNQAELSEALATYGPYYDAVAGWANEGVDPGKAVVSNEQLEEWVLAQGFGEDREQDYPVVRGLQNAYNAAVTANKPYVDLLAIVAESKSSVASGDFKGDPAELNAVVAEADALIATLSSEAQTDVYQEMVNNLQIALDAYYSASSTYYTPAEITIVDGEFKNKGGNGTGGTTQYWNGSEDNPIGWISYTTNTSEYFRYGDDSEFQVGRRAAMWRGWTGNPKGHLYQDVTVVKPGHYQLVCQAYVTGDNIAINNGIRTINVQTETQIGWDEDLEEEIEVEVEISRDTVYHSGVYLELCDAAKESISLGSTAYADVLANNLEIYTSQEVAGSYVPQWFTLSYDVTEPNTTLRFGINGLNTGYNPETDTWATYGPNAYGIGSVHLYYYGPSDDYYKDAEAEGGDYNPQISAIKDIKFDGAKKPAVAGVFTLTGQKVANSLNNSLAKGIYIFNGKKYYVK